MPAIAALLMLASAAHAEATGTSSPEPQQAAGGSTEGAKQEGSAPNGSGQGPELPVVQETVGTVEQSAQETVKPVEQPVVQEVVKPVEQPVVQETVKPVVPETAKPVEKPVVPETGKALETQSVPEPSKPAEAAHEASGDEHGKEPQRAQSGEATSATSRSEAQLGLGGVPSGGAPPAASTTEPGSGAEVVDLGTQPQSERTSRATISRAAVLPARRGTLDCLLSVLGGRGGCTGAWTETGQAALPQDRVAAVAAVPAVLTAARAAQEGPPPQSGGGSVGGGPPLDPTPGPAPVGGAAGGASAGSGAGVGLAGCMSLAFLLLLAAPGAMRRLRLARLSWRTSFVVLIAERPD